MSPSWLASSNRISDSLVPPPSEAPPAVDVAVVAIVLPSVAPSTTLSGVSRLPPMELEPLTATRVAACTSLTATVPPAVLPVPSALLVTVRVVIAFSDTAPSAAIELAPTTSTVEVESTTVTATAASLLVELSPASAASVAWMISVTAESMSTAPVAVIAPPSTATVADGRPTTSAPPSGPNTAGMVGTVWFAVAFSTTSPAVAVTSP
ncbi:MAG: hypothetical protein H6844_06255 [Alphaproteobacteria bacterium]|nr:hypothetical protein [Alphaproteobacteria bacterium]